MAYRLLFTMLWATMALPAQTATGPDPYFFMDASAMSAEGTWVPVDPKDRAAYQAETKIDCEKRTGQCVEATAIISPVILISLCPNFQIVKWSSNGIVATNADGICATRTMSIGFASKHISDTREAKALPLENKKGCEAFGVPPSDNWNFLLKNSKSWATERDREHMN